MTETKSNPFNAPWTIEGSGEIINRPAIKDCLRRTVAITYIDDDKRNDYSDMRYARLIVAAPEMFSLLERIVKERCDICSFSYGVKGDCSTCLHGESREIITKVKGKQ